MSEYNPSMEEIGIFIKQNIREWVQPIILEFNRNREINLAERFVRVEEELKSQRELMKQGFELSEKRFEDLHRQMDQRFLQIDKRFEQVDKRFEQIDKRFCAIQWAIGIGFTAIVVLMSLYQFYQ